MASGNTNFATYVDKNANVHYDKDIVKNPLYGVCIHLSYFEVDPKNWVVVKFDEVENGFHRLCRRLGRALTLKEIQKFGRLPENLYSRLEETWSALMQTVLMNRDFDPTIRDMSLLQAVQATKKWFLKFALRGGSTKIVDVFDDDGQQIGIRYKARSNRLAANIDKLADMSKQISAWLQYAALTGGGAYHTESTTAPKPIPMMIGWDHDNQWPTLPWMGGHLSKWRTLNWRFDDDSLVNVLQMRSFGRALPCPSELKVRDSLKKGLETLTKGGQIDTRVLQSIEAFAEQLGRRLDVASMPIDTHISVSASASFDSTQEEGGKAADMRRLLAPIKESTIYETWVYVADQQSFVDGEQNCTLNRLLETKDILYDVFGEPVFTSDWLMGTSSETLASMLKLPPGDHHVEVLFGGPTLLEVMYTPFLEYQGYMSARREANKDWLPNTIGKVLRFISTGTMLRRGEIAPGADAVLRVVNDSKGWDLAVPLFFESGQRVRYTPRVFPPVFLTCLAEPSFKARTLGKGESEEAILFQSMRFMAEPVLARDGRARLGLEETNKLWTFLKYVSRIADQIGETSIIENNDFDAATDEMLLSLIEALWSGFLRPLPPDHPFWVYTKLIWCPRQLVVDRKILPDVSQTFETRRGSMMGEPISFLTLTLYNLVVDDMTNYYAGLGLPLYSLPIETHVFFGPLPTAICGDDVTSIRPHRRFSATHRRIITDTQMVLSTKGKDSDSLRVIFFCEDSVIVSRDTDGKWKFTYIDVIKGRLLTRMARQGTARVAAVLGKGRMLANQLEWFPSERVKCLTLAIYDRMLAREYSGWVERIRLPKCLPAGAGGLGLPYTGDSLPMEELFYARYVRWLTNQPRTTEMVTELLKLRALGRRLRYGVEPGETPVQLIHQLVNYTLVSKNKLDGDEPIFWNRIYRPSVVIDVYERVTGKPVPFGSYKQKPDYDDVVRAGREIGLVPMWDYIDVIERLTTFNELLTNDGVHTPDVMTLNDWVKRSGRFWRRVLRRFGEQIAETSLPVPVNAKDVNWWVQDYWGGFVTERGGYQTVRQYGPSMAIRPLLGGRRPGEFIAKSSTREPITIEMMRSREYGRAVLSLEKVRLDLVEIVPPAWLFAEQ